MQQWRCCCKLNVPLAFALPRQRFLVASSGDHAVCEKRIKATLEWRRKLGLDTLLTGPHPCYPLETYTLAKAAFPHGLLCWSRSGYPIYFDSVRLIARLLV